MTPSSSSWCRYYTFKYDTRDRDKQVGVLGEDLEASMPEAVEVAASRTFPNPEKGKPPLVLRDVATVDKNQLFMYNLGATQELLNRQVRGIVAAVVVVVVVVVVEGRGRDAACGHHHHYHHHLHLVIVVVVVVVVVMVVVLFIAAAVRGRVEVRHHHQNHYRFVLIIDIIIISSSYYRMS